VWPLILIVAVRHHQMMPDRKVRARAGSTYQGNSSRARRRGDRPRTSPSFCSKWIVLLRRVPGTWPEVSTGTVRGELSGGPPEPLDLAEWFDAPAPSSWLAALENAPMVGSAWDRVLAYPVVCGWRTHPLEVLRSHLQPLSQNRGSGFESDISASRCPTRTLLS
jgi:hypothetical protein